GSPEPGPWDLWGQEPPGPDNGALLLSSHHDDLTFGDVTIEPLSSTPPVAKPDSGFAADLGSVEIDVLANDVPGDILLPIDPSTVKIVAGPSNGTVAVDPATGVVTYTHTASGTTTDSFAYVVDDTFDTSSGVTAVTVTTGDLAFESDDFNFPTLDSRWTWIPATAGSFELVGAGSGDAHLAISVPAGTAHDKYNAGDAPRVMQDAADIDFVIETKYETQPAAAGNVQGILVEEDPGRWLRFDVQHTGTGLKAFIGNTTANSTASIFNGPIAGPVSHLRVARTGDLFTYSVSSDGLAWTEVGAFTTTLTVNSVGVFASNPFGEAWTSEVDYFFHTAAPVDPEDPVATPPATDPDSGVVQFDLGSIEIDVLANDDPGNFPIVPSSVAIVDDPSNGTAEVNPATGVVTYTHTAFGTTTDSFTYTVDDVVGTTSAATTVTISVDRIADDVVLVEPNGMWHIRVPGNDDYTFFYGNPGDVPLFGDWDGDGFDTPGMYRPSNGFAYLTNTLPANGGVGVAEFDFFYGIAGDQVFWGDWDGDGADSLGISRNGKIYLANTNATVVADLEFFFGLETDIAFGADLDGDGKDSVIVYRESNSFAYYTNDTSLGLAPTAGELFFGAPGDGFTIGDWDTDLVDTPGVFRGSDTTVYLTNSLVTGFADESYVWGTAGWTPVAGVHGVVAPPV
ncbi:MAG: hypothetical protein KJO97_10275, partial [Acidimicrobiia bacterium]|nr:hypothetical protein [Acidimicrobiia bacterium]